MDRCLAEISNAVGHTCVAPAGIPVLEFNGFRFPLLRKTKLPALHDHTHVRVLMRVRSVIDTGLDEHLRTRTRSFSSRAFRFSSGLCADTTATISASTIDPAVTLLRMIPPFLLPRRYKDA